MDEIEKYADISMRDFYYDAAEKIAEKMSAMVAWQNAKIRHSDWHEVVIPWNTAISYAEATEYWDELAVWITERLGAGGVSYYSYADMNSMSFIFKHERDAIMTMLRWQ